MVHPHVRVTYAHFETAVIPKAAGGEGHTPCELAETGEPLKTQNPEDIKVFRGSADGFVSLRDQKITRPGLERYGKTRVKCRVSEMVGLNVGLLGSVLFMWTTAR
jgi:hypothetical protein